MNIAAQLYKSAVRSPALFAGWLALFLFAAFAYRPGLNGPFVLDDFGAIAALGSLGGVVDWASFKAFVFGGQAGPTGRPVALLTFLIDANNWPAETYSFKRTNLLIHLLSGLFLGVLIRQILMLVMYERRKAQWIALASAAIWLLHPFLVSTTLYAVQRMAQLSALFTFVGLVAYLYGRSLISTRAAKAYWIMSLSIGFFGVLAVLSKENGILLPMLVGVIEVTVIASQRQRLQPLNRIWAFTFLALPSAIILIYLSQVFFTGNFFEIVPPRDFSLYERLLTQSRIIVDYLQHWFIPSLYTTGIFQDHFIKSTGLLSPATTILCTLFHIVMICTAAITRKKMPLFALATLFFYAGHLLESTVLNLEMYFEHRNYLPACFLFVPLISFAWNKLSRPPYLAAVSAFILLLGGFTHYSSSVWADFPSMVAESARKAPMSVRAQARQAANLYNAGRFDESVALFDRAIREIPGVHPLLLVNRAIVLCNTGRLDVAENGKFAAEMAETHYDPRMINAFSALVDAVEQARCPDVPTRSVREMFIAMSAGPVNGDPGSLEYSQIQYFIGLTSAQDRLRVEAVAAFEHSLRARPGASHAMQMAAVMASRGFNEEALYLSGMALGMLSIEQDMVLSNTHVSREDIESFQAIVREDINSMPSDDSVDAAQQP